MSDGVRIVAIDGPVGAGKSSVARRVAQELSLPLLETGAMYRAVGLEALDSGVDPTDREAVEALAAGLDLRLEAAPAGEIRVLVRGRALDERIRDPRVSEATSICSAHPGVRRRLVDLQRQWSQRHGAVVEGRDIGTRVFPDTPFKFFLEASVEERARRRIEQWRAAGRSDLDRDQIRQEIRDRDLRDRTRRDSPLTVDESYVRILTDSLTEEQVVARIVEEVRRLSAAPS